jgi:hypothetical protein
VKIERELYRRGVVAALGAIALTEALLMGSEEG